MSIVLDILDQETQEIHAHAKRSSTRVTFPVGIYGGYSTSCFFTLH